MNNTFEQILAFVLFNIVFLGFPILMFFGLIKVFESIDSIDPYANEKKNTKQH